MRTVKMRHKALKEATAEVPESAVRHHERAGWVRVEGSGSSGDGRAVESQPAPEQTPPVIAGGSSTSTARRQPTTERSAD